MAAGDLITEDWQFEYDGYLMGGNAGVTSIVTVDGLQDMPDLTTSDLQRLRRHGLTAGDDFMGPRTIGLELEVYGADAASLATELTKLMVATAPGSAEIPLCFQVPGVADGGKRQVMARPRKRSIPIGQDYWYRIPIAKLEWLATDPLVYSQTLSTTQIGLPVAPSGLIFPLVFPWVFPVYTTSTVAMTVGGTYPTSPTIVLTGPVVNPLVQHSTGKTLSFDIVLAAGETLTINAGARTVLYNGSTNYYGALRSGSQWFDLNPGSNTILYLADTFTASTATVTWRSAWI